MVGVAEVRMPMPSLAEVADPAGCALVVIDVQKDFCGALGACANVGDDLTGIPRAVNRVARLLEAARKTGMLIVFVQANYDPIVLSPAWRDQIYHRRGFKNGVCLSGTDGIEFVDGTGPIPGRANEVVVVKHRYSAFWGTDIDVLLRSNGISTVLIAGVATEGCPESTARDAFFRDYRVVTVEDCVASFDPPAHNATLKVLAKLFGPVVSSDDLVKLWEGSAGRGNAGRTTEAFLDPEELLRSPATAVILANAQNDFCDPTGLCAKSGLGIDAIRAAAEPIAKVLEAARRHDARLMQLVTRTLPRSVGGGTPFVRAKNHDAWLTTNGREHRMDGSPVCQAGTWGSEVPAAFGASAAEPVIVTRRASGFTDTSLDLVLRSNSIRNVVLMGFTTSQMIETTAREGSVRDYNVYVVEDCVADFDSSADLHAGSLKSLARGIATVVRSHDLALARRVKSVVPSA